MTGRVAGKIALVTGAASGFVTGAHFTVDGGFTAAMRGLR